MKLKLISIGAVFMTSFAVPCYAQSSDYENAVLGQAMEARVGITIPFGGDQKKARSKPQLKLSLQQDSAQASAQDWAMRPGAHLSNIKEFKLSFTLEPNPTFLINEEILDFENSAFEGGAVNHAMDTYDKTVLTIIGVSLAVIAGSIIAVS